MRQVLVSACIVLGIARVVAADGYDVERESASARSRWASDLKGVRFGTPVKKLLAWVPAGTSIDAWAFSPSHRCDHVDLRRISGTPLATYGDQLLVGESIVDSGVRQGREFRAWKAFAFGDLFSEGGEALRGEERGADGTWHPAGESGTIGEENATYGVLSYVDAIVARFGGTHLSLYAECVGPVEWLECNSGGERPCVGCKSLSVTAVEANAHYEGLGFNWGHRRPTCHDACPPRPPNPAMERLYELQSHVTVWQPTGETLADTPSLHRTLADCMHTHYQNRPRPTTSIRPEP